VRISIYGDATVSVTTPARISFSRAQSFVKEKMPWIAEKIFAMEQHPLFHIRNHAYTPREVRQKIEKKVMEYCSTYSVKHTKITIRNQKTRWGSCSKSGSLSFNQSIVALPEQYFNYIVAHEVCHLREFNHSKKFWNLVAETIPEYRSIIKSLRF
jgi:predicted metal-dependent hydrolase